MTPFTDTNRPQQGKFAFVITKGTKGARGQIFGGQVSYSDDSICFNVYINDQDIHGEVAFSDVKEWMYAPELEKYYNF